jgi:hypothetical protein
MGLRTSDKGGGDYELIPANVHEAICYGVIDLGTQMSTYNGEVKEQEKVMYLWELPKVRIDMDGVSMPKVISKEYTQSVSPKANLHKDLVSWRGRAFTKEELEDFDLTKPVGVACQLQVIHKTAKSSGNDYAFIQTIMKMPDGTPVKGTEHEHIIYELTPGYIPEGIPDWIKDKIKTSLEWKAGDVAEGQGVAPEEVSDVEPF